MAGLLERADGLARRLAQPHLIWLVSFSRAGLAIMLGDLDDAEQQVQAALALGVTAGRRMEARAFGAEQIAEIRRLQGRLGELGEWPAPGGPATRSGPRHPALPGRAGSVTRPARSWTGSWPRPA